MGVGRVFLYFTGPERELRTEPKKGGRKKRKRKRGCIPKPKSIAEGKEENRVWREEIDADDPDGFCLNEGINEERRAV